jgi:hypothetical protein
MPKPRSTIPIAHADDVPTIAFTDEQWQAIEQAYGRQLNADVRQQITTVTIQYLKDSNFDRTTALKEMALKRIKRVRRAAGDLERVMFDREAFSAASDELSRQQQQSAHSYADGLIRRHLDEGPLGNWDKLHLFRHQLKSLVVGCDCALNDLSAAEYRDGQAWDWWIQGLTRIAQRHELPDGARIVETSGEPSPFVALVRALHEHVPAKHTFSVPALAKAIWRAQDRAGDK